MASTSSSTFSLSSPSCFIDKSPRQSTLASPPQCLTFPALPPLPVQSQNRSLKISGFSRKIARNVTVMATGEASSDVVETEVPEIVKKVQETWGKVEDKYAVTSLGVAAVIALWSSTGLLSAIDRLPLIPGILEIVGIGYTVWFAYNNLVFEPDREALIMKVKDTYKDIIGSSG